MRPGLGQVRAKVKLCHDEELSNLGRGQTKPWRAEQKAAALVAWMSMAAILG